MNFHGISIYGDHSASYNPDVDFFLFTDLIKPEYCPDNVRFIRMSFNELKDLVCEKIGFEVSIDYPYKLCDFRPAYGIIFAEWIKEYDFWGIGDIDVIYGKIRNFITDELLSSYDYINVRNDYIAGFFALFKNTEQMNTLYLKSRDYRKVFTDSTHYRFDECDFPVYQLFQRKKWTIHDIEWKIETMAYVIFKERDEKRIQAHFEMFVMEGLAGGMTWNKGILKYNNRYELLLYHLITFKSRNPQQSIEYKNIPDIYYIDSDRIRFKTAIPKIIHQIWGGNKALPNNFALMSKTWRDCHPPWRIEYWNDERIDAFVKEYYPQHLEMFRNFSYNVQRWDTVRFMIMYIYGGIYTDFDTEFLKPFDDLIENKSCFFSLEPDEYVHGTAIQPATSIFGSIAEHPFIKEILRTIFTKFRKVEFTNLYDKHWEVVKSTGPLMLAGVYENYPKKESIYIVSKKHISSLLYDETIRYLDEIMPDELVDEIEKRIEDAYAVHYYFYSWHQA